MAIANTSAGGHTDDYKNGENPRVTQRWKVAYVGGNTGNNEIN
jgi:hypothetical protein